MTSLSDHRRNVSNWFLTKSADKILLRFVLGLYVLFKTFVVIKCYMNLSREENKIARSVLVKLEARWYHSPTGAAQNLIQHEEETRRSMKCTSLNALFITRSFVLINYVVNYEQCNHLWEAFLSKKYILIFKDNGRSCKKCARYFIIK